MDEKYFNRKKLFWMFKAHQKNMKSHDQNQKEILEIEENAVKWVIQTLVGVASLVLILSAILYTVLWFVE